MKSLGTTGLFYLKSMIFMKKYLLICVLFFAVHASAQTKTQMVRIAKVTVDPAQLDNYKAALKKQMTTAVATEPGVLSYNALADKANPSHITILEVYTDVDAYKKHIETAHFKEYKATVQNMVKSLELVDVNMVASVKKPEM